MADSFPTRSAGLPLCPSAMWPRHGPAVHRYWYGCRYGVGRGVSGSRVHWWCETMGSWVRSANGRAWTGMLAASLGVTRRESEVLNAVVGRLSNAEIAATLFVSERTVESHVSALLRKLDATNRLDLVDRARLLTAPPVDDVEVGSLPDGVGRVRRPWCGADAAGRDGASTPSGDDHRRRRGRARRGWRSRWVGS